MKIENVVIKILNAPFNNLKTNSSISIEDLNINYNAINIHSDVVLRYINNQLIFKVGCQSTTIEDLKLGLRNLRGELLTEPRKGIKNIKTKKFIESDFQEESQNYYISKSGRAYDKNNYILEDTLNEVSIIKESKNNYGRNCFIYKGYGIGSIDERKELIKKLTYLIELHNTITNHLKGKQLCA